MLRLVVLLCLLFALFTACTGQGGFEIVKKPGPDSEGFLDPDTLQVVGIGYPSPLESDPLKQKQQSLQAAVINGRMRLIDFFLSELQEAKDTEHYVALARRVGNFSSSRYDPIYGKELLKGGGRCDALLDMLGIRGYIYKSTYELKTQKTWIAYRVVRAGLLWMARSGFTR